MIAFISLLCLVFGAAVTGDGLEQPDFKNDRYELAQKTLENVLSHDVSVETRQKLLSVVFELLDADGNGLLSNEERSFLFKDVVTTAVDFLFGDAQTLTVEDWCAVEFDVVPHKLAPSSQAEREMICQWEEDVIAEDCAFDFSILTKDEVLTRGQMTEYYYAVVNPDRDWTPTQFEAFLFNSKLDPFKKILASQAMEASIVNTVTTHTNDCSGVSTKRRSLQFSCFVPAACVIEVSLLYFSWVPALFMGRRALGQSSLPLALSIVSNLASSDDCEFTNCPELHGMLGMLQHNTFCEEGAGGNCIWVDNLLMPSF